MKLHEVETVETGFQLLLDKGVVTNSNYTFMIYEDIVIIIENNTGEKEVLDVNENTKELIVSLVGDLHLN